MFIDTSTSGITQGDSCPRVDQAEWMQSAPNKKMKPLEEAPQG